MKLINFLYFFFFTTSIQYSQTRNEPPLLLLDASFDEIVEKLLAILHVPGISLAIVDGDDITTKVRLFFFFVFKRIAENCTCSGIWFRETPRCCCHAGYAVVYGEYDQGFYGGFSWCFGEGSGVSVFFFQRKTYLPIATPKFNGTEWIRFDNIHLDIPT